MPKIEHDIFINAPIEVCFDLARNIEIHTKTTSKTREKAIAGVTKGLLEKGDIVTWEAIHFGMKQRLTAQVIEMQKPNRFVDIMLEGIFHSFVHTHHFIREKNGTIMKDQFQYKAPLGVIGLIADKLFLEKYMENFIISRANALKKIAENK
ncbi:SRPBCC family protein [Heyndrickxia vini]|uniref:SRPBCC family protein n=1 Tax=Heyndrickxia vini TaxID=1476025 RepID=A0ABX7DZ72_9BACI|nr:SRPBCC family protein [Heyndrickxia vini]QQZ08761.1 SRPBCC family protein [Heyndrickxia vini]